ncbi:VTT domain-containing protein [Agromyces seonyuensis]|uniref:DedA family protein n=1 Tax=Agromyces seonyuensis TaxID=2662446 RepID=A0A6I4P671_9MICO|nr:DedA family protein [Agromyces seonyuensis]
MHTALIPWLDPELIISAAGPWALVVVCAIVFAETGLLVGFLLPGDTLLIISGLLTHTSLVFGVDIWWVCLAIGFAAFLGGEVGYFIGRRFGPRIFERRESGIFSIANVERTNRFFERFGGLAVILARFVPIVRTFTPVAAGVGRMNPRKYSLYNFIGALLWGVGLTFAGYLLGYIPPLAHFVTEYIDVILVLAVLATAVPTVWHYLRSSREAKRAAAAGEDVVTDHDEAAALVLDPEVFERRAEPEAG